MIPFRWLLAPVALLLALASAAAQPSSASAGAAAYPSRPLRFIVPFPPGGSDTIARIVAQKLTTSIGSQVIVDNRPGAGGTLGTEIASKAAPDGYTMLFATASFAISPHLYKSLKFDPIGDFSPVTLICSGPMVLAVNPSVDARTTADLLAYAKSHPKALNYASTGTGSITHLTAELFARSAGIAITHVPYKGTGPALTDLMAGQVQLAFVPLGSALSYVRASKLRALGVASLKRSAAAPDIATIAESGLPGFEAATWYGVLTPAGTPRSIVRRLNTEIGKLLGQPDTRSQLTTLGFEPQSSTPQEFSAYIRSELKKWGKVVRAVGVSAG
jgi:tripartite-type tricarboxylate transporter receptor subunit TctC